MIEHIGDGVYAEFHNSHGTCVSLRANDHRNPVIVVLEPEVLQALVEFYGRCLGKKLVISEVKETLPCQNG